MNTGTSNQGTEYDPETESGGICLSPEGIIWGTELQHSDCRLRTSATNLAIYALR
jgi:hypothetical protein